LLFHWPQQFIAVALAPLPQQDDAFSLHLAPSAQQGWTAAQQVSSWAQQLIALVQQPSLAVPVQQAPLWSLPQHARFCAQQSCRAVLSGNALKPGNSRPKVRNSAENRLVEYMIGLPIWDEC
jgi:hypothetical protein